MGGAVSKKEPPLSPASTEKPATTTATRPSTSNKISQNWMREEA